MDKIADGEALGFVRDAVTETEVNIRDVMRPYVAYVRVSGVTTMTIRILLAGWLLKAASYLLGCSEAHIEFYRDFHHEDPDA